MRDMIKVIHALLFKSDSVFIRSFTLFISGQLAACVIFTRIFQVLWISFMLPPIGCWFPNSSASSFSSFLLRGAST